MWAWLHDEKRAQLVQIFIRITYNFNLFFIHAVVSHLQGGTAFTRIFLNGLRITSLLSAKYL